MPKKNKDLLISPSEILENNPQIKKVWTAQMLGYLRKAGLFSSVKYQNKHLILQSDVLKLFEFYKHKKNIA